MSKQFVAEADLRDLARRVAQAHVVVVLNNLRALDPRDLADVEAYLDDAIKDTRQQIAREETRMLKRPPAAPAVLLALVLFLGLQGCATPKEGDRQLNDQNQKAAARIRVQVQLIVGQLAAGGPGVAPAIADALSEINQCAQDIGQNSLSLEKNLLDKPAKPQDYSPKASEAARKQSEEDHATPAWLKALGALGLAALGWFTRGGALRMFARVAPRLAGGPVGIGLSLLVEGIARVRERIQSSETGTIDEASMLEELQVVAQDPRAHALVKDLAHKAEAKLALRLPSPEPPAPPPAAAAVVVETVPAPSEEAAPAPEPRAPAAATAPPAP